MTPIDTVKLNGRTVRLRNADVIGVGGEATVFNVDGQAVKVYLQADAARDAKLRAMLPLVGNLPPSVVAPQSLVLDRKGKRAVGFAMRLLDATYTDVRQLANKKYRAQARQTARDVARLFLNAWHTLDCIHRAGMVVGDLNDLNVQFRGDEMVFIDADSFQFANYPCMVGTEAFLDPTLYGKDLSQRPYFTPANDWYAFAVLLFKSLLLAHPYGGVHPAVKQLTARAQQRISIFDAAVTYPRIAYSPDLLTDDLAQVFTDWFTNGQRGVFPQGALQQYLADLKDCPHCGAAYPQNRAHCPMCAAAVPVSVVAAAGVRAETLLHTRGDIITWRVMGKAIHAITHEGGKTVHYTVDAFGTQQRTELFNALPDATYDFLEHTLVISPARDSDVLMVVDISGEVPTPTLQTTTAHFGGVLPVFGTSRRHLYRIAGGYLMRGRLQDGQLVEQSVLAISAGQTWFTVAPDDERVFGYYRVFNDETYWLLRDGNHTEADVTPLVQGEFLTDISVVFAADSVLVVRQTQYNGVERVHVDEIDHKGRRLHSTTANATDFGTVHGHAYMRGVMLQATDAGIVQTRLDTHAQKTFSQTEPVVQRGDSLLPHEKGLLAVTDRRVLHVMT